MAIKQIRRAIRNGQYQYTNHALEEMDADDLTEEDVRNSLLHGEVVSTLTDDPRGIRFVVQGNELFGARTMEVVCRFLPSSLLRIITVYVLEE
ncbi:MAG: DUF4258 domain-containing protein [Acidobacteria bacterium]|nr:DUF4258 domain-containing protein [Acidobacteriota bacterium]